MIERKDKRSARNAHFDKGDGTFVCKSYTGDVHYENWDKRGDGEGGWRKIDTQLLPTAQGWDVLYAPYIAKIPSYADGDLEFNDKRSDGVVRKNILVTSTPIGALHVAGIAVGNSVVYQDAMGVGVDLVYEVRASGIARLFRISAGATHAASYSVIVRSTGMNVTRLTAQPYNVDNRGPKVVDTSSYTAIGAGGAKTYLAPFMCTHGGRQKAVQATLTASGNELVIEKHVPGWYDGAGITLDDTSTTSTITDFDVADDDDTWADVRSRTPGAYLSAGLIYYIAAAQYGAGAGDADYTIYRAFFTCTNTVPVGATISTVKYIAKVYNATGSRTNSYGLYEGTQTGTGALGNYDDFNTTLLSDAVVPTGTVVGAGNGSNGTDTWTLNASGRALVSPGSTNKYCMREYAHDGLNSAPVNLQAYFMFTWESAGNQPYMEFTYNMPAGGQNLTLLGVS